MKIKYLIPTILLLNAFNASAEIMDFNNLPTSMDGGILIGRNITQNDFTITSSTIGNNQFQGVFTALADGWQNNRGTSNGTTSITINSANSWQPITFDLIHASSKPFSFTSIDIGGADANNGQFYNSIATDWTFTGYLLGGEEVSYSINTNPNIFSTYYLPTTFTNLLKVSVSASIPVPGIYISNGAGMGANFDNIVASALPVPEPSTYALLLAGLGMTGVAARRKNRVAARRKNRVAARA